MIDIHSHIIYDIDDGSQSLEMSLEMLKMSVASGVTDIIATPHTNRQGKIPEWSEIEDKAETLRSAVEKENIPINIYTGAEIELNGDVLRFLKGDSRQYCLANSAYVLLELTEQSQPDIVEDLLYEIQMRGYYPILAHIERFSILRDHPERVIRWAKKGILTQCNTGSFTGYFGPKLQQYVRAFYRNHLIHFLGSDGHRVEFRTTDIRGAHQELDRLKAEMKNSQDLWQDATRNAEFILKNKILYPDIPDHWQKEKKGFFSRLFGR